MAQRSYGLLKGKQGVVFGPLNEQSLAWQIALACHREGAKLALSNIKIALRLGEIDKLAKACDDAPVIVCDASSSEDLEKAFAEVKEKLGRLDFVVHSVGRSENVRKGKPYEDLNYDWFHKTLDVSALSLHRIVSEALRADALKDGGSIVSLSYIGAQRNFPGYSDMGDAKALLESITRSFGYRLGERGIRINTVSQSPTKTSAGSGIQGFDRLFDFADRIAPLGNASAPECGDFVVVLLSDLTRKVTMQNLYHDGGFSAAGVSEDLLMALYPEEGGSPD